MKTPHKYAAPAAPPAIASIDPSKIMVRAFKGFLWSPTTRMMYYAVTREPVGDSTYFRPFSVTIGYGFEDPIAPLCPIDYATPDTADAILAWARASWPMLTFDIVAANPTGGFVTQPQYFLVAWNGADLYEVFGAGLWAFDKDKDGEAAAYEQRTAELQQAGFGV